VLKLFSAFAFLAVVAGKVMAITGSVGVSGVVAATCTITTSSVSFGPYSGSQLDSVGQVIPQCLQGVNWTLSLGPGTAPGATTSSRRMMSGVNELPYALYRDAARTENWGNALGTDTVSGAGTGLAQSIPVYGRIPAGANMVVGTYTDVVLATVTF
jgi:spore coat protein U-like protein